MSSIPGLLYIPQYINQMQHNELIQHIDSQPWKEDLKRRTQHYGYVYNYRTKAIDSSAYLGGLPVWLEQIALQLSTDGLMDKTPDQAIINEYFPGQGIASHVDCIPCFGDVVASLSLLSSVVMDFKQQEEHVQLLLEPSSLLILRDDARYHWTHGIAKRSYDTVNGVRVPRHRRISITFRNVVVT